jgi:hypothetical protein
VKLAGPIDALPLWALFVVILLVVLLSVEFGYRLGKYRRSRREEEKEAPLGTMVGGYAWFTRVHSCVHVWIGSRALRCQEAGIAG